MAASTAVFKIEAKLLTRELGSVFWMLVWGYFVVLGLWTVVMTGVAVRWFRWE